LGRIFNERNNLLKFARELQAGDPAALVLLGLVLLLGVIGIGVWLIDRKAKRLETNHWKGAKRSR
jgi:hypothetical protein